MVNAPSARVYHTAVWTGSEMIVWGGYNYPAGDLNDGDRYNPATGHLGDYEHRQHACPTRAAQRGVDWQ